MIASLSQIPCPARILGTGYYLPDRIVSNTDYENAYGVPAEWIFKATGIRNRRIAAPSQACTDLAILAAKDALQSAKTNAADLDLIILATIQSDYTTPPGSCIIQAELGAHSAAAFDIDCACLGYLWGIVAAMQFVRGGLYKKVLVIASDVCSRALNYDDPHTFILMGDGAGACVIEPCGDDDSDHGLIASYFRSDGREWDAATIKGGGSRFPNPLLVEST